jgi:hypothetical protein
MVCARSWHLEISSRLVTGRAARFSMRNFFSFCDIIFFYVFPFRLCCILSNITVLEFRSMSSSLQSLSHKAATLPFRIVTGARPCAPCSTTSTRQVAKSTKRHFSRERWKERSCSLRPNYMAHHRVGITYLINGSVSNFLRHFTPQDHSRRLQIHTKFLVYPKTQRREILRKPTMV